MANKWECDNCNTEFNEREIETKLQFMGNQVEPSEYSAHCPNCDSTEIGEINAALCTSCEDEIVQHEGDQCEECRTCQAEAAWDAANGH